jgi:hypothetical protein
MGQSSLAWRVRIISEGKMYAGYIGFGAMVTLANIIL